MSKLQSVWNYTLCGHHFIEKWLSYRNFARRAELMIDYGVGVSTRETYVLKRADEDYFVGA